MDALLVACVGDDNKAEQGEDKSRRRLRKLFFIRDPGA
jgi:hypothetical protein